MMLVPDHFGLKFISEAIVKSPVFAALGMNIEIKLGPIGKLLSFGVRLYLLNCSGS